MGGCFFCKKVENGDVFFVKKWKMGGVKMFFFLKKVDLSSTQGALCTVSVFFNLHFYLFGGGEVRTHPMHPTCLRACGHVDEWCRNEPTDMPFRGTYAQCTHSGWRNLVLYGSRDPHLPGKGQFFLGGGRDGFTRDQIRMSLLLQRSVCGGGDVVTCSITLDTCYQYTNATTM